MKKSIATIFVVLLGLSAYSYEWQQYGPPGVKANKFKFIYNGSTEDGVLIIDTGFYIVHGMNGNSWEFYNFHASDVEYYNEDTLLVIYSMGSYSDGVYFLDKNTHESSVITWLFKPSFIHRTNYTHYYIGFEFGLFKTDNGHIWEEVSLFANQNCINMAGVFNKFTLATDAWYNNVYYTEDSGNSWITTQSNVSITEMEFGNYGIYGASIDEYGGNGLYKFVGYDSWEQILNIPFDAFGLDSHTIPFVGWNNGTPPYQGIARYKSPSIGLEFLNNGLPNLNITDISNSSSIIGGPNVYCCTEGGAFRGIQYAVGDDELLNERTDMLTYPNPFSKTTNINYNIKTPGPVSLVIYDQNGQNIYNIMLSHNSPGKYQYQWNPGNHPPGIYYCKIISVSKIQTAKLLYNK